MARYANAGTATGLFEGGTVDTSSTHTQTGTAVTGIGTNDPSSFSMVSLSSLGFPDDTSEIWVRFDIYSKDMYTDVAALWDGKTANGTGLYHNYYSGAVICYYNASGYRASENWLYSIPSEKISTVYLHISPTMVEFWIDGTKKGTYSGTAAGSKITSLHIKTSSNSLSNFILADYDCTNESLAVKSVDVALHADTERLVKGAVALHGDTLRRTAIPVVLHGDTLRGLAEKLHFDTLRKTTRKIKLHADTQRMVAASVHLLGAANRYLTGYVRIHGDTARKLPTVIMDTVDGQVKTKGTQQIRFTLQERTISDRFSFTTTGRYQIGQRIQGKLLDFPYVFDIESTSHKDLLQTCNGMYAQDALLNSPLIFKVDKGDCSHYLARITPSNYAVGGKSYGAFASTLLRKVANALNMPLVMNFANFVPSSNQPTYSAEYTDKNVRAASSRIGGWIYVYATGLSIEESFEPLEVYTTYKSVLSSLFSWADAVPRMQVNVYIRNGTMYAIQRGRESGVIDLDVYPHTRPQFDREIVRTMWGGNPNASEGGRWGSVYLSGEWHEYEEPVAPPKSPVMELHRQHPDGSSTDSVFQYEETDRGKYLRNAHVKVLGPDGEATQYVTDYEMLKTGQRFGHTYAVEDDASMYPVADTLDRYPYPDWHNGHGHTVTELTFTAGVEWHTDEGDSVISPTSIAVEDSETKQKIYEELKWMNRKTKEEVQIDIVDNIADGVHAINHIFDFDTRYKLGGNEYFLVSNAVTHTPRQFIQSLRLVRWY